MKARLLFASLAVCALIPAAFAEGLSPLESTLVKAVSANTMKGHVSFLASDALEGRDTPSPGLDVAAEYIASQLRAFGVEPLAGGSYFQDAPYVVVSQPAEGAKLTLNGNGKALTLAADKLSVTTNAALEFHDTAVVKMDLADDKTPLPAREVVEGRILLFTRVNRALYTRRGELAKLGARALLVAGPVMRGSRLREAAAKPEGTLPVISLSDSELRTAFEALPAGPTAYTISGSIPAPVEKPIMLRNVIGILPGSDPDLKDTAMLLSAHYDHVGRMPQQQGDNIYNGANDDASGVATVLELARVFSQQTERPKRTLIFAFWFGEEKGLLGSRFYAKHPVFPLAKTIANLNLEHMGRTDDNEGPKVGKVSATGFDYSEVIDTLAKAGTDTGVEAWKHPTNSDEFFSRSDNQALADAGVPAHTLSTAWIFPDYHRPGDHWDKLDYANMAKVTGTVAVTVWRLAERSEAPKWNESNPKTARYVKAWRALTGAGAAHHAAQ